MSDNKICQEIMRKAGKTYYFAVQVFPKKIQLATYALYAFYRVPDDIVDLNEDLPIEDRTNLLLEWVEKWRKCIENEGKSDEAVLREAYKVHLEYKIDFKYAEAFFKAMIQDLSKTRYANYDELEEYMYGSAAVVGIMMTHLIGVRKSWDDGSGLPSALTLDYASKLGYAMQLTNFMRDICEDIDDRNRIYLPEDEYLKFVIEELDFAKHKYPEQWNSFMELQLHRAERFYREAEQGVKHLNWYGQLAVKLAARLYEAYHKEIRKSGYKVYHFKYSISGFKKIYLLIKSLFV